MNKTVLIFLKVLTLIFLVSPVTGQVYESRGEINPVFGAFWNMDIAGSASQTNDRFGQALAEGDFNGDGLIDLAIGMPGRDVFGNDEGMVIVLYGATGSLSSDNSSILFSTDIQNDQNFATSLTSGDFNNDGFDDLVVGTPNKDYINPQTSIVSERTGAIYIHYGSSSGVPTIGMFIDANSDDVSVQDRQSFAEFGRALTTADFNNDGYDDLVVSAPNHDLSDQNNVLRDNAGMVFVYYGGQQTSGNMGISHMVRDLFHQNTAGIIGAVEENDFFGYSLGAGDFNNDGFGDLVVGVPFETIDNESNSGIVQVIYGSSVGLLSNDEIWRQSDLNGGVTEVGDLFGFSIATGDVNNDGNDDLVVGSPLEDIGAANDAGAAHFIPGSTTGLMAVGSLTFSQQTTDIFGGPETADQFGFSVAISDLDIDGLGDIIIGVPFEDNNGENSGFVHIIPGQPSGLNYSESSFLAGNSENDTFGYALSSSEHYYGNSLIVSAPNQDSSSGTTQAGGIYEYFYENPDIIYKDGFDFPIIK